MGARQDLHCPEFRIHPKTGRLSLNNSSVSQNGHMLEPFTPRPRGRRQATTFRKLAKHPPRKKIQITPSNFMSAACEDSMYLQYSKAPMGSCDNFISVEVSKGIRISKMKINARRSHPIVLLTRMNFACLSMVTQRWSPRLAALEQPI